MPEETSTPFPLEPRLQNRNALIYAAQISMTYLGAPALNIGFVQAGLCKHLDTSNTIANLPSTIYLATVGVSVVVAWLFPQARLLKPILASAYTMMAVASAGVAFVLCANLSSGYIIGSLLLHATLVGSANGVVAVMGWEVLSRAVSDRYRGKALSLAFGVGPAFAVIGSLGAQVLLNGSLFNWTPPTWLAVVYPYNYALLFAIGGTCTALAAFSVRYYEVPLPTVEMERESFSIGLMGGLKSFLSNRVLLIASVAYMLVYCGNMVQNNMSLFTQEAVGRMPEELAGYQLVLRFSFKILCGFFLGWLLVRTNPKAPLLVTIGLQIAGVLWVLFVPGYWFLLAFGINGAGELFGVYYMNYPMLCSPKAHVRRDLSFLVLISSLVGLAPVLYGWISDTWSLRASFWAALALLTATTVVVIFKLPTNPRPPSDKLEDQAPV